MFGLAFCGRREGDTIPLPRLHAIAWQIAYYRMRHTLYTDTTIRGAGYSFLLDRINSRASLNSSGLILKLLVWESWGALSIYPCFDFNKNIEKTGFVLLVRPPRNASSSCIMPIYSTMSATSCHVCANSYNREREMPASRQKPTTEGTGLSSFGVFRIFSMYFAPASMRYDLVNLVFDRLIFSLVVSVFEFVIVCNHYTRLIVKIITQAQIANCLIIQYSITRGERVKIAPCNMRTVRI